MDYRDNIYSAKYRSLGIGTNIDTFFAKPHHDASIEIIQFWSDGGYFVVGNKIFPIRTGYVLILDALDVHYSNPSEPELYIRNKLIVSQKFFRAICDTCGLNMTKEDGILKNGVIYYQHAITDNTIMMIDNHYKTASQHYQNIDDPFAQINIVSSLISILTLILPKAYESKTWQNPQTIDLLAKYVSSCDNHWENISMEQICNNLHISPSRASHLFKELTGKSLTQYITLLRMAEAKRLLLSSNLKVKEISIHLKFDDPTTFCRYFRKYVGCSPNEYRTSNGISTTTHNF